LPEPEEPPQHAVLAAGGQLPSGLGPEDGAGHDGLAVRGELVADPSRQRKRVRGRHPCRHEVARQDGGGERENDAVVVDVDHCHW
jgi:hypothetical protein